MKKFVRKAGPRFECRTSWI